MPLDPRLLLATEDLALSRTLSWVLKENGYDVVTASGGPQLAERLDQEEYDLLVLDVGDGDAGSLDRLVQLRDDVRTADLPMLVLADLTVTPAALEPHGLGSADLVSRPYRVRELLARIKAHLRVGRELNRARAEARSRSEMVEILKEVTSALEPDRIYQILVRRVAQGLRIARCSVVLAKPNENEGTVVAAFENPTLRDLRVDLAKYPEIAEALRKGETVMVSDVDQHPLYQDVRANWATGPQGNGRTRSVIALPFALRGEPSGVFFLRTTEDDPPLNRIDLGFAEQVISAAVTALEKAYDLADVQDAASLRALADSDPLTGLPNRRVLEQRLGEELDRARRYDQVLTVALVDLDHFKAINDQHGHQVGDAVLRQLAGLLRRELRTNDMVARIGGEEFVMLLPETGVEGARLFVDRLLRRIGQHNFGDAAGPVWVTASVGLATFPDDRAADEEALLKLADDNLYRAKHAGRNRYRD
ncbi:MAG TPA: diguanylate cyclase [Gemmatimonadales bacterium]|nr:diguanylate cyclase [Gemmatimonadales bacterium]